ncbi:hypothetical protein EXIGLDRAFT_24635 [Exidia glandulosa HHB12029]|uniref:Uncharacterized protein n=1 Tax=Exidia glandulosa HHB12029 TaxID=1314781 RepID=A0A166BVJ6_EXIGL|nr:hypothetical protein EXIGLDRAFT_24635 [Exidia glandulosa HHB12029]
MSPCVYARAHASSSSFLSHSTSIHAGRTGPSPLTVAYNSPATAAFIALHAPRLFRRLGTPRKSIRASLVGLIVVFAYLAHVSDILQPDVNESLHNPPLHHRRRLATPPTWHMHPLLPTPPMTRSYNPGNTVIFRICSSSPVCDMLCISSSSITTPTTYRLFSARGQTPPLAHNPRGSLV